LPSSTPICRFSFDYHVAFLVWRHPKSAPAIFKV
jgi:hypothetical protein